MQEGIGLDAVNDAFLLESSVYRLLKKYCGERPYYLHLLELFLQVSLAPASRSRRFTSALGRFWMLDGMLRISDRSLSARASCQARALASGSREEPKWGLGLGFSLRCWDFPGGDCVNKSFLSSSDCLPD